MSTWIVPPVAGLIEPMPAMLIPAANIGAVALNENVASVYYYTERPCLHGQGTEKVLQAIIERSPESIFRGCPMMLQLIEYFMQGRSAAEYHPPPGFRPHLVR